MNREKNSKRASGRPSQSSGEDLKDRILKAFLALSHEQGVSSVTLQKVAERSEVAFATVRYHFNVQGQSLSEGALHLLLQHAYEVIEAGIAKARELSRFDPIQSYIEVMFKWIEEEPLYTSYLAYFYYLCTTQVVLPYSNKTLIEAAQKRLQTLIHEGLGLKLYNFSGSTSQASQTIHAAVMGGFIIGTTSRDLEFLRQQKEMCHRLAQEILRTK